jgi:hypothetical protein
MIITMICFYNIAEGPQKPQHSPSFDQWSSATSGAVSVWMGDHRGKLKNCDFLKELSLLGG